MTFAQVLEAAAKRSLEKEQQAIAAKEARSESIRREMASIEEGMKKRGKAARLPIDVDTPWARAEKKRLSK